jgi:hypothetical protein
MDDALKQALQYLNHAKILREIAKEMEEEFDLKSSQDLIEIAEDYEQRAAELALQLLFLFEMSTACFGLVGAAPERPCDDACGLDTPLCEL